MTIGNETSLFTGFGPNLALKEERMNLYIPLFPVVVMYVMYVDRRRDGEGRSG